MSFLTLANFAEGLKPCIYGKRASFVILNVFNLRRMCCRYSNSFAPHFKNTSMEDTEGALLSHSASIYLCLSLELKNRSIPAARFLGRVGPTILGLEPPMSSIFSPEPHLDLK